MTRPVIACIAAMAWFAALLAATCLLAGLGGAAWPEADFLNQFAPLWSVLGLGAVVVLLVLSRRRRATAALAVALVVSSAVLVGPELAAVIARDRSSAPGEVRVVQFNVWRGNRAPARAAAWVLDQRPDIVVLQEAADIGGQVARGLAPHYPFRVTCRGQKPCSTVILSRARPVAGEGLARGDAENREALSAAWARYEFDGRPLTVVAVHLARPWPWDRQAVDRGELIARLRQIPDRNLILVGDFNTTPWTFAGKRQDRELGMDRITRALFTWPDYLQPKIQLYPMVPILPIDQAYVRSGLLPVAVRRGPRLGSDHRPVVLDLAWASPRN